MILVRPITTSRAVFRTFTTADAISFPVSASVLDTRGRLEDALLQFYSLDQTTPVSPRTFATFFHACARLSCLDLGRQLHTYMLAHHPSIARDFFATNNLINMYAKCGHLDCARVLFDQMPHRNHVSWTSLISGYAQNGNSDECFSLFSNMLAHYKPNDYAYTSVLSACSAWQGRQVHALALKSGFGSCVYVGNALIGMYSKKFDVGTPANHCVSKTDEAWRVFESMDFRNTVSWNSMIARCQKQGGGVEAVNLFATMSRKGLQCDRATLVSVLSSLCKDIDSDYAFGFTSCSRLHAHGIKSGFQQDVEFVTAMMKAYSDFGGELDDCYKLFTEIGGGRDIVLWTEIMTAFSERAPSRALHLFVELCRGGLRPDCHAFSIVLKASAGFVTEMLASALHCQVIKVGFHDVTVIGNALIHAYSRCGAMSLATLVFNEIRRRDIVSWNSMLKAYALHGQATEAVNLFELMNVEPDATTFVSLLTACNHAGMVEEGTKIFHSILEDYGIVPELDHYACLVDMQGRAGNLLEAKRIIEEMPMEPDYAVWSAFLGSCRKHNEPQLADLAASKLKELEPRNSLGYVLLSNIYSTATRFDSASLIQKQMREVGISKEPGLSWTEIGNQVHEFASGGRQHPQIDAIRAYLMNFVRKLNNIGYITETSLSPFDLEEEHKEEQLLHHSEKLALVFALMNANASGCCQVIRIMKNIRICLDCHNFMKFASDLINREIVIRDSNRFHHFKKGLCSCNDFW